MANFEQKKLNINNINGGQKFTSGSQLTPDALNGVVEGLNLIDKKFVQNGSTGQDAFIANNGFTNGSSIIDNRAIKIGNTQSIGVEYGALRFWDVINGSDYSLDVSPTIPSSSYKKATLGGTNPFRSIHGELVNGNIVQAGNEKLSIVKLWSGAAKEVDISNYLNYKLFVANIFFQFDSSNYFVFSELVWNVSEGYGLGGGDYTRHYVTAPANSAGKYIDITRSVNKLTIRQDGAINSNYGYEALYGVLLH